PANFTTGAGPIPLAESNDPLRKEIDRPLGLGGPGRANGWRPGSGGMGFGGMAGIVAAVAILALSATIALRPSPFRDPAPQPAQSAAAPAGQDAQPAPSVSRPAGTDGPSIIRVSPPPGNDAAIVVSDPSTIGQNLRVAHL